MDGSILVLSAELPAHSQADRSLKRFKTAFPAGGSPNSGIELTIAELEKYSECRQWIDVCKVSHARESNISLTKLTE